MALQLIGAGFGRTGTLSLYTALNSLGLPCYHMVEVLQNRANRHHLAFWRRVGHGRPGEPYPWDEVLGNYVAAVDNPASCVWRELLEANPGAKRPDGGDWPGFAAPPPCGSKASRGC